MIAESVKFRGHGCFKNEWAGFDTIKPINVIIGRNNTGKSHLNRKNMDKMELASKTCPHMTREMMQHRFELAGQIEAIIAKIQSWNA
jgi:predicted GTPase